jgi:undecaprenyl-diphosphatase
MRQLGWIAFALVFLGLFLEMTFELHDGDDVESLDRGILLIIAAHRTAALNGPAVDVTALGSPTVIALLATTGVLILGGLNRDRWGAAYLALGSLGAGLGTSVLKQLIARPRPTVIPRLVEVSESSYPSGHSFAATSFYLLLMFLAFRHYPSAKARGVLLACALVLITGVCLSRLYLGVHYPSDVLGGALLGAGWVCFLTAFLSRERGSSA